MHSCNPFKAKESWTGVRIPPGPPYTH